VFVEPDFKTMREAVDISGEKYYETFVVFYINQGVLGMATPHAIPVEIQQSLRQFQLDHPYPNKVAFIMMKFGKTTAHDKIVQGIKDALAPHGITGLRADDKEYHADLYPNVLTYLYGCGFGIAVFERIEREDFNPNVSLEVGYIMALGKQVCLLKDQTLTSLHTDLVGKLYKTFDPQDPVSSIPPVLEKWMQDRGVI
jgi:nucleoside 2-deoxyribosyltransferase